jgi:hypothetical protein
MLRVELPEEIAGELVSEGLAVLPGPRGNLAPILVDTAAYSATAISLLQTPDTFIRLAQLIKSRFGNNSTGVRVTVKGDKGSVDIEVTADTDLETFARLIKEGLVGKVR